MAASRATDSGEHSHCSGRGPRTRASGSLAWEKEVFLHEPHCFSCRGRRGEALHERTRQHTDCGGLMTSGRLLRVLWGPSRAWWCCGGADERWWKFRTRADELETHAKAVRRSRPAAPGLAGVDLKQKRRGRPVVPHVPMPALAATPPRRRSAVPPRTLLFQLPQSTSAECQEFCYRCLTPMSSQREARLTAGTRSRQLSVLPLLQASPRA